MLETEVSKSNAVKVISGDSAVLARRYAHALYLLASEKNALDEVAEDLLKIQPIVQENAEFRVVARHPRLTRAKAEEAVRAVAKVAGLGEVASDFIALMARKRRLANLDDTINAFLADLAKRRGERPVEIFVAKPLSDAQKESLHGQLSKIVGGKIELIITEDPSLLGGMMVKIGSHLLDASIKGKLARFERQLKNQKEAA
jgi:F-type H+-transporting ATPase subunit delta